jgi:hypothetical protein
MNKEMKKAMAAPLGLTVKKALGSGSKVTRRANKKLKKDFKNWK